MTVNQAVRVNRSGRHARAFAAPDLLALLAMLALLCFLTLPISGNNRTQNQSVLCLANLRMLANAFQLYAQDNNDLFAENYHGSLSSGGASGSDPKLAPWANGWLEWGLRPDSTNQSFLRERRYARMGPYIQTDRNVHKCPADVFLSRAQRAADWRERVRTVALNGTIGGGNAVSGPWSPEYSQVKSLRQVGEIKNSPSGLMTFIEEHPDSINDPLIFPPYSAQWVDLPASLHNGAVSLSFIDGSAELHAWTASGRLPAVSFSFRLPWARLGDPDLAWFRKHSAQR